MDTYTPCTPPRSDGTIDHQSSSKSPEVQSAIDWLFRSKQRVQEESEELRRKEEEIEAAGSKLRSEIMLSTPEKQESCDTSVDRKTEDRVVQSMATDSFLVCEEEEYLVVDVPYSDSGILYFFALFS
jgi:hypothetical protein